jgi:hypothetical protein
LEVRFPERFAEVRKSFTAQLEEVQTAIRALEETLQQTSPSSTF